MIVFYDNVEGTLVIWDDGKEVVTVIRECAEEGQGQYPIEITVTEYEHIQFIEPMLDVKDVIKWAASSITDEADKKKFDKILQHALNKRANTDRTGSLLMKNTYPITQNYKNE